MAGLVPAPGRLPLLDKSQPSVPAAIDVALRRFGGCPTYLLTDTEKTVTVEHEAGIPVRIPGAVAFARHYGLTIATCVPADPATKGGSEATVRIAKAYLVPTAALLPDYVSFAGLEAACGEFCGQVNTRPTGRPAGSPPRAARGAVPAHPDPPAPFTTALGFTRKLDDLSMVSFEGARYSVPHRLAGQAVWVRRHGEQAVIVHAGPDWAGRGRPQSPHRPGHPLRPGTIAAPARLAGASPRARTQAEAEFLAIVDGAGLWLAEAAASGASRVRAKMARTVQLARLHPAADDGPGAGEGRVRRPVRVRVTWSDPRPPGPGRGRPAGQSRRDHHPGPGHHRLGRARHGRR